MVEYVGSPVAVRLSSPVAPGSPLAASVHDAKRTKCPANRPVGARALARIEWTLLKGSRPQMKGIATAIFLAASIVQASEPIRRPWGIETRVPWTASHVQGTPDAPDHYRTAPAFPHIRFD